MTKLLIIEDDMDMSLLLKKFLNKNGYEVELTPNGTKGIAAFTANPADLVLCDYRLGDMDGIQVYSGDLTGVSVLHIMNGNGEVIKFYRESALTIPVSTTVDGTYDSGEAAVINNLRERLNELEARLQNIGILY